MREFIRVLDDCFNDHIVAGLEHFGNDGGNLTNYSPYFLTDGQLHGFLTYILEETTDCLVVGKASGCGEYVVLQECNGGMGNLGGEVTGLAFAEAKVLLAIFENHLDRPTHGVDFVCLGEVKGGVSCHYSAPWGVFAAAYIEQANGHVLKVCIHDNIMTAEPAAVLHSLGVGRTFGDDGLGRYPVTIFGEGESHTFLPHLNHSEIMAFNSSSFDKTDDILAGKPAVSQKIIKSVAVFYRPSHHLFEKLDLASGVVLHSHCGLASLVAFFLESPVQLSHRHGMVPTFAWFPDKFKINDVLTFPIGDGKHERLKTKYHPVGDMAEDTAYLLSMCSALGVVRIINYEANGIPGMVGPHSDPAPELASDVVHNPAPVKTVVVDESIKHILRCAA